MTVCRNGDGVRPGSWFWFKSWSRGMTAVAPANHVIDAICLSHLHQIYGTPHFYFVPAIVHIAHAYNCLNIVIYEIMRKMTYPSRLSILQNFCFSNQTRIIKILAKYIIIIDALLKDMIFKKLIRLFVDSEYWYGH